MGSPIATPLVPRHELATWVKGPPASLWLLVAGPGSGKTCTARFIAEQLGRPSVWLQDPLGVLPGTHEAARDSSPEAIAHAFRSDLLARYPEGVTLVIDEADRFLGTPETTGFLKVWLQGSSQPLVTIVTSRRALPFPMARRIASGEAVLLGPSALWLTPEEVDRIVGDADASRELVATLAGWPLGVFGLRNVPPREAEALIAGLVREELIGTLDEDSHRLARELSPFPTVPLGAIALFPGSDPAKLAGLREWGLFIDESKAGFVWHPWVRRLLKDEWDSRVPAEDRRRQILRLGEWAAQHDPEQAIHLCLQAGEVQGATEVIAQQWRLARIDLPFARWLAHFPSDMVMAHPHLLLIEGSLLSSNGDFTEAAARLKVAAESFRTVGDQPHAFEALSELLGILAKEAPFDREAFCELAARLAEFESHADVVSLARYFRILAGYHVDRGDYVTAMTLFRKVLNLPHLRCAKVLVDQQLASLNLGALKENRGEFQEASLHFRRAISLEEEFRLGTVFAQFARLHMAIAAARHGDHAQAEALFREVKATPWPELNPYSQVDILRFESVYHLAQGSLAEADACYREAMARFAATGREQCAEMGEALCGLATVHGRRGDLETALQMHSRASEIDGDPQGKAERLVAWALTLYACGAFREALEKLQDASVLLDNLGGTPYGEAIVGLALATVHYRQGDVHAATDILQAALKLVRQGSYYYQLLAHDEIAPDLWSFLLQTGHTDLLAQLESRFPSEAHAIRTQLERRLDLTLPSVAPPAVGIRCFGDMEVTIGSTPIASWPRRRAKALLAHLLLAPRGLSREELIDRLFPERDGAETEQLLGNLTSTLRKLLEPGLPSRQKSRYLLTRETHYRFDVSQVRLDFVEFEQEYRAGEDAWRAGAMAEAIGSLERAVELYRGDLFDDTDLRGWFELDRHRFRTQALDALNRLAEYYLETDSPGRGQVLTDRILVLDPVHEEAHRRLMRLFARYGRQDLIRAQYDLCKRLLAQQLDAEPALETGSLYQSLIG